MTEYETRVLALLDRMAKAFETIAAAQRFLAEQQGRRVIDDEVQAERDRNSGV